MERLEAAGRYEAGVAGTEVGGDWYDVMPLSDDRLAFSVGDVCGRGLGAAALMASLRYSIRAYALEEPDPATILARLSTVMEHTPDSGFATVICGTLDAGSGVLSVARAGHFDILAVDRRGARYLDSPLGPPVGVDPAWEYRSATIPLDDDVMLLAFTDGLVERRGEHLDIGLERLRRAAEVALPIDQLVAHVVGSLTDADTDDDIAVLGLHWTRATTPALPAPHGAHDGLIASVELPADAEAPGAARRILRDALSTSGLDGRVGIVELLTAELVANVVRHVGAPMQLRVLQRPTAIRVEVDDVSGEVPVRQAPDSTAERGRGMLIVESLARAWGVERMEGGKTVWFEVDIEGDDWEHRDRSDLVVAPVVGERST
jgi:anti-sigma regulatory factor (Ser/Thr protein kinase)